MHFYTYFRQLEWSITQIVNWCTWSLLLKILFAVVIAYSNSPWDCHFLLMLLMQSNHLIHYWIKHERTYYDELLAVGLSLLILINAESHQMKAHHKETIRVIAANITIFPSDVTVSVDLCQISKPSMRGTTQSSINQFSPKELWTWMIINYFWLKITI